MDKPGYVHSRQCFPFCDSFMVKIIKPAYVRWLSFRIARDGIITNRTVLLLLLHGYFGYLFDTVFLLHYIFLFILYLNGV